MKTKQIAVKCIGFGRIVYFGGRSGNCYLVHLNESKDWFQLFGGALRCSRAYAEFLKSKLEVTFAPSTKKNRDKHDLRILLPQQNLELFVSSYHTTQRRKGKKVESDCERELREEIGREYRLLPGNKTAFSLDFWKFARHLDTTQKPHCVYLWDFFDVGFKTKGAKKLLLENLLHHETARLVTRKEIEEGKTTDGEKIADSVKLVLP